MSIASWSRAASVVFFLIPLVSYAQNRTGTKPETGIVEHRNNDCAIIHASVIPEPGKLLEQATIVIRDGKIVQIGTNITPPADSRIIDLKGKTIYAGFVDLGVEMELPPQDRQRGAPYWNPEICPERSVSSSLGINDANLAKLRRAGVTTALVAPRDGIVKGTSSLVMTASGMATEHLLRDDVALHLRLTIARGRSRDAYPSSPMGAVALARQTFSDAQWYAQAWQVYQSQIGLEKPEKNDALEAINRHVEAGKPVIVDALNEQYALRADSFGKEFGLNVILKGSGQEYQLLDRIAKLHRAVIVPVNFPKPPNVAALDSAMDVELEELIHWELAPENPARLHQAGVKFVLTSSGLNDPNEFVAQIRKAVQRGLDKQVALESITTGPASLVGIGNECGSLKPGAWANLVVMSGDLWDEKSKIEEVWVRGDRPSSAYKIDESIDGKWDLKLRATETSLPPSIPSSMILTMADSTKKISGTLELEKGPAQTNQEPAAATPESEKGKDADAEKSDTSKNEKNTKTDDKGKAKFKNAKWEDRSLSASIPVGTLIEGQTGSALLTLTLHASSADGIPALIGTIVWPNGESSFVNATKKTSDSKSDKSDSKPATVDKTKPDSSKKKELNEKQVLSTAWYPVGVQGRNGIPDQPDYVVFKNTTLWTCGPDGLLKNSDLLIHRGIIQKIGTNLPVPDGATVIDGSKYQISPGLIDCHSHMANDSGINEGTQAVTAEVRIGDFVDASDISIYRQLAGGLTTANLLHGSANPIGGQNQVIKLRWGAVYDELRFENAPAGIKFALGENVKRSNLTDNTLSTRYPSSRMGVEQIFRDRFNAAIEYDRLWKAWNKQHAGLPPRRDLELEAIAEVIRGERWIHCHSYRQDEILGFLRVLEDYKIKIGSLQHILEGYKVAEALAKHGATASSFSDWWNYKFEVVDAIPYNGAIMYEQGIIVSFNSDDSELGRHMNHEAAKAMKYGNVPAMEALKFVTLNPAKQLRIDSRVGSLEIGKDADIAVWTGSPLSAMSRCEQTWIDGRKYFDRSWDAETRIRDGKLHHALVQKVLESGEPGANRSPLADDPSRLWPHHDEYCHHSHDEDDEHE